MLLLAATAVSFILSLSTGLTQILQTILLVAIGGPTFIFSILSVTNLKTDAVAVNIGDSVNNHKNLYNESISSNTPDLRRKIRELQNNLIKPSGEIIEEIEQTGQFSDIDFSELLEETKKESSDNNSKIPDSFYNVEQKNTNDIKDSSKNAVNKNDDLDDFTYIKTRNHTEDQIH